jgi:preprotein translocase subunit SecG
MRLRVIGCLTAVLIVVTVFTGAASAQTVSGDQEKGINILENVENFLAKAVSVLGGIFILVGVALYGGSQKGAERAQRGIKMIIGGGICIVAGASITVIRAVFRSFAPGMTGIL